jgi:hypothetical protein
VDVVVVALLLSPRRKKRNQPRKAASKRVFLKEAKKGELQVAPFYVLILLMNNE